MAITKIKAEVFTGKDGKEVNYERLLIQSQSNKDLSIELRLDKNDLTLVKAILASDGVK